MLGAGGGILAYFQLRARDFWFKAHSPFETPDYESGALARLGYPGKSPLFLAAESISLFSII